MFNKGDEVAVLNDAGLVLERAFVDCCREKDRNVYLGYCCNNSLSYKAFNKKTGKGCNNGMRIELWDDSKHVVDERTGLMAQFQRIRVYLLSTETLRSILELTNSQHPATDEQEPRDEQS